MPSYTKPLSHCWLACLMLWMTTAQAGDYSAQIRRAELIKNASGWQVDARIDYRLSPTAKEALHKGIPLIWKVQIEIRRPSFPRDQRLSRQKLRYALQFHALLNQYAVQTTDRPTEMFLSLHAALNYMAALHVPLSTPPELLNDEEYQLAIKTQFHRESLPVPLRPFTYLDRDWFLSSDWLICPIPK